MITICTWMTMRKNYRLIDKISFRQCSLYNGRSIANGNCTNFDERSEDWKNYHYWIDGKIKLNT